MSPRFAGVCGGNPASPPPAPPHPRMLHTTHTCLFKAIDTFFFLFICFMWCCPNADPGWLSLTFPE